MKKSWLIFSGVFIALCLLLAGIGWDKFNKTHEDLLQISPDHKLTASALFDTFSEDESRANELYLGQIIEIEGKIVSIETPSEGIANLLIGAGENSMGGIICSFSDLKADLLTSFKKTQKIKIRGSCSGFLMDVNLVRCIVVPQD